MNFILPDALLETRIAAFAVPREDLKNSVWFSLTCYQRHADALLAWKSYVEEHRPELVGCQVLGWEFNLHTLSLVLLVTHPKLPEQSWGSAVNITPIHRDFSDA